MNSAELTITTHPPSSRCRRAHVFEELRLCFRQRAFGAREQHKEHFYITTKVNAQIFISVIHYKEGILKIPKAQAMYLSSLNPTIGYNFL